MKTKITMLSLLALFICTSATIKTDVQSDKSDKLIGTWVWSTILDASTNQDMGLDMVTMGMTSEVKTEFKKDKTYIESKLKKESSDYATVKGEWKLEPNDILSLKAKDKWRPIKILKMANDSLVLQMNPKMNLVMVKQK